MLVDLMFPKFLDTLDDTATLAATMAPRLTPSDILCLHGRLGVGKTTFAKHLIANLTQETHITSPTFNILQVYGRVYHYDLYRLRTPDELREIGLWDNIYGNISLIEWPELIVPHLPEGALHMYFGFEGARRYVMLPWI